MTTETDRSTGAERPPQGVAPVPHADVPGTRLMVIVRWILLAMLAALAAGTWWAYGPQASTTEQGPDHYYCPMHPQIRSPSPGTCPICYMNLEPIPADLGAAASPAGSASAPPPPPPAIGSAPPGLTEVMLTMERRNAVGIATAAASRRSVARDLRLPAVIESPKSAVTEVRVRSPGFVEGVMPIEIGAKVKAGQGLAWLYVPEILVAQQELLAAHGMAAAAGEEPSHHDDPRLFEAARQRLELLGVSKGMVDKVIKDGKALRGFGVSAPRSGVVTARNVSLGSYVGPESVLFEITDLTQVWASATVAIGELSRLPAKTPGALRLARRRPRARRPGRPRRAAPRAGDPHGHRALRREEPRRLAPAGRHRRGHGSLPSDDLVVVPRDAVIDLGTQAYVFVERTAGVFTPRLVEAGAIVGEERTILAGLEPGEIVVARGAFLLDSESRLQGALAPERTEEREP